MDMNDNRNNGGSDPQQPYTYQYGADQQQPGGYYYNPYGQYNKEPQYDKPRGNKGLRRALIAIFMVLCIIGGSALGVYVLSPGVNGDNDQSLAAAPTATQPRVQEQTAVQPVSTPDASLTTENPQIGGEAPDIDDSEGIYVQIAEKVGPAVVVVRIDDPAYSDEYDPQGTGIIISSDGYIVTNNHVISERASYDIMVDTSDGTEYKAGLVGMDETTDLAVLKIDAKGLTAAALGDSDALRVGEEVVAIGNALGMGSGTVTTGIISGLNKEITNENYYTQEYIQTDAAINPGNSGGPLINMAGEVIGINTLKSYIAEYDASGQAVSSEGIGFAIPINTALPVIEQIMMEGSVVHPGIGITGMADENHQYNANGPDGVTVISVTEGGPADLAGIQENDIITAADGVALSSVDDLVAMIQTHDVGDRMTLTVWRDGQEYQATVTVGDLNQLG